MAEEELKTEVEFTCNCGRMKNWIAEGVTTQPCPLCHRVYFGVYHKELCMIVAKEVKPRNGQRLWP